MSFFEGGGDNLIGFDKLNDSEIWADKEEKSLVGVASYEGYYCTSVHLKSDLRGGFW